MQRLAVAGLTVEVDADDALAAQLPAPQAAFLAPPGPADFRVRASWRDLTQERGAIAFDSGGVWQRYAADGPSRYRFGVDTRAYPYKVATLDFERGQGEVELHAACYAGLTPEVLEYPLDEMIWGHLLARRGGALLHACGRAGPAGGDVCVAHSGGGKSTLSMLLEQHGRRSQVLSDERIAIREEDGTFAMYGTPWHGDAGLYRNVRARIARVLFLAHGAENVLTLLPPALAAARLYACAFPPAGDARLAQATLDTLARLVERVPAFELAFRPDAAVVELLERDA